MPPRSTSRRSAEIRERLSSRPARKCDIERCFRQTHQLSRWCASHAQRAAKHGGPEQKAVFKRDLLPFLKTSGKWLRANAGHLAVKLVVADLDKMLADAASVSIVRKPKRADWQSVARLEMTRLHRGGCTGIEILELALALFLFAEARKHVLQTYSRPFDFALTRLVFGLRIRAKSERRNVQDGSRLPTKVRETVGNTIVQKSHLLLRGIVKAMHQAAEEPKQRVATLAAALEATAFSTPSGSAAPTTTPTTNKD